MNKVSVITVVFNARSVIKETIESVLTQTYRNMEYIIIDGGSSDGTVQLIQEFAKCLSHFESTADRGIYHAMNKGIVQASGDWVCFMNAGDRFFSATAIEDVMSYLSDSEKPDIVYGGHEVRYRDGVRRKVSARPLEEIWKGSRFSHQSALISSEVHRAELYNESNSIAADFEFFYRAYANQRKFLSVPVTVASVEAYGISDQRRFASIFGWWRIIDKSIGRALYYAGILLLEVFKWLIKRLYRIVRRLAPTGHTWSI